MTLDATTWLALVAKHQPETRSDGEVRCAADLAPYPCDCALLAADATSLHVALLSAHEAGKADERARIRAAVEGLAVWQPEGWLVAVVDRAAVLRAIEGADHD